MTRLASILILLATAAAAQSGLPPLRIDASTFEAWLERITPVPRDLYYQQIPWRLRLSEGVDDAARLDKPILLWLMDGHPLGPT